ncbi:MAG: Glycosyl transferase [Candidatus Beckwithbacteria bacterium GW2011_GWB1_47_15]|uniref:Glycosyl transferase n=1 Tax=Candidatus Beckwithbacteria bacterium GW2011_GWB1_47_15 TaxID=1618371 RepID=A0A0G1URZ2_9BACT|nr:MAG: glycosyl transferase [Candidatus Beckwithbacteria bacterium GW2011_GWC1_49_16]AQS30936.1 hypothetical protein [uncultured bacterium]KKU34896.1 MAG: Glycosyl transferase [Candidatus Beckwithbacteria bacterium GW2011_GWA1_46_30]KKU60490.1 MAG: Glycosyl transferase [Candidatus Beckwithbacteria bacterium GW2011_GWB1_47_15]KKU72365.1 MAG: Glycosyl transferase [Candidatus Beckwithbacteria bacterium GW2011_GWA2_47_25]OGD48257.1 MAG: hypothetical protein A2877_01965 [Candidatus Beckwithbacteri
MFKGKKVSAVVPVYNEQKTVASVVWALILTRAVDEVVVVNDGSTDKSLTILDGFGEKIKLINLKKNRGKGGAVAEGIKASTGEIIVMADADLVTMEEKQIKKLLAPLSNPQVDGVIGQRFKGLLPMTMVAIAGERAYYKNDLILHLEPMKKTRFGLEMYLNQVYKNKRVEVVALKGLWGLFKYQKRGQKGFKEMWEEFKEVAAELKRQGKLPSTDIKLIKKIRQTTSWEEIEDKVAEIDNRDLREFLQKYVLTYLKRARRWLNEVV